MARFWSLMRQMAWFLRVQALLSANFLCKLLAYFYKPKIAEQSAAWHPFLKANIPPTCIGFLFLALTSNNAYADATDLQNVLTNISQVVVPLTGMVLVISYACGVYMIFRGLAELRKMGHFTMSQSQNESLSAPLLHIVVGTVLIWLPTSQDTLTSTLFGSGNSIFSGGGLGGINYQAAGTGASLLSYLPGDGLTQQWNSIANTLVLYIQFLGLISFIKGWFLVSKSAGPGAQPGNFAKGLTHIIGGIIAINFVNAVNIISNTIYGS